MQETQQNEEILRLRIQGLLGKDVVQFSLKGKGLVNNAYYAETADGKKYLFKVEREDKEFQPQNSLPVEAAIIQELKRSGIASSPIPNVVLVSANPDMYGYAYIEGELMRSVWPSLSEEEKIKICQTLGSFHAEIGKKISKEAAAKTGIEISDSTELHPETIKEYAEIMASAETPEEFKILALKARFLFSGTYDKVVFQFLHNDSHHENILIRDKLVSGIIDFGNAEYGEIAKEFSRYIRDFPDHFQHIVSAYEKASDNILSQERLISNAFLSGLIDILEDYKKGGEKKEKAMKALHWYERLLAEY